MLSGSNENTNIVDNSFLVVKPEDSKSFEKQKPSVFSVGQILTQSNEFLANNVFSTINDNLNDKTNF